MVSFECKICNYKTIRKNDFKKHLNTKKHKNKEENNEANATKSINLPHKNSLYLTKAAILPHKTSEKLTNFFECSYCSKIFKRKDNLNRHIKKYCKEKKKEMDHELILKHLEDFKKDKAKMYAYIDKLVESAGDTNNINIEANTQNNQIVLNNFGNEDISHLTDKFMQRLLSIPYVSVQKIIEKVHFSKKKPENKNIALTNKKEDMIKIYKNNKWKYQSRDEIMDEIINTNYTRIDDFYNEKGKKKLNDSHNKIFESFQDKFEGQDDELINKIRKDCEMLILSDNL